MASIEDASSGPQVSRIHPKLGAGGPCFTSYAEPMVLVEAVCCSLEDVDSAVRAGAGRVELCSAIELGGLTPSIGLVSQVSSLGIEAVAMVRPRSSGFLYMASEIDTMAADAEALFSAGIKGIVFAALEDGGRIDAAACARILRVCPSDSQRVFHRAFDATADLRTSMETLIELGFTRILTSGGADTALAGAENLARLVDWAHGRIEILPAGGVRATNAAEIIRRSGSSQIHLGPIESIADASAPFYGATRLRLDGEAIRATVLAIEASNEIG